ncbi:MAG TPA: hypothetical protein VGK59_24225 [Ohtaekwangia sp.]
MIIYGSRPVHLKSAQPPSLVCPHCGQTGTTFISAYSKHAHIFWIPLFPIGRVGVSQCQHCKQALNEAGMPHELKREYTTLKAETRVPIWQFAGLGVIGLLAIWITYIGSVDEKKELEYLADPAVGDVYRYKTETKNYSTLKVVSISADSVFVSPNDYETDKMSGVHKIDKEINYSKFSYGISRADLKEMHTREEIYDIDRN